MLKNHLDVRLKHEKFVRGVCESNIVYALESEEGFATSSSNEFEDEEGNPAGIICFWSERALAKSCIKGPWQDYQLAEITLSEFIENWMVGMYNDELLTGTNFDQNMFGFEIEPLELAIELIAELKKKGKTIDLLKYENLDDLERQIADVLDDLPD